MQSFSSTEPAVDLTAASPLAFAPAMAGLTWANKRRGQ
jgi:hypothetical protein